MANLQEGGRRLTVVGRAMVKIGLVPVLLGAVAFGLGFTDLVLYWPFLRSSLLLLGLFGWFFWLAVFGLLLSASGSIVSGFGLPTSDVPEVSDRILRSEVAP